MTPHWLPEDACGPAREWLGSLPPDTTPQQVLDLCPHADWILWLAEAWKLDVSAYARHTALRAALVHAPAGLRFSGLTEQADTLAALPESTELADLEAALKRACGAAEAHAECAGLPLSQHAYNRAWAGAWATDSAGLAVESAWQRDDADYVLDRAANAACRAAGQHAGEAWAAEKKQQLEDARRMLGPALVLRAGAAENFLEVCSETAD